MVLTNSMAEEEGEVAIAVVERDQVEVMEQEVCVMVLLFNTTLYYLP